MKSALVIHHSADMDGLMSGHLAMEHLYKEGFSVDTYGLDYGEQEPDCEPYDLVMVTDFSLSVELMGELHSQRKLVWIDHHATAINKFDPDIPGLRRVGDSATKLCWEAFHSGEPPLWLELVDAYDVRRVDSPMFSPSLAFDAFLKSMPSIDRVDLTLGNRPEFDTETMLQHGNSILRYQRQRLKAAHQHNIKLCGVELVAIDYYSNECFSVIDAEAVAMFFYKSGSEIVVSLRSEGKVDVGAIAAAMEGGGHHNAAGFRIDPYTWHLILTGQI